MRDLLDPPVRGVVNVGEKKALSPLPLAKVYQKAINNHRKMEEIIQELRALSLAMLEATTEGVVRRKPGQ